ncbi:MAG: tRNA (adenosine(37)-N6)-threonylcarbamoyltransferase complex ATPase subunit type 1 TsaE [Thermoanaerobacteraceae bacterium]|nr:tRNA (adenosine(37)-N6)-threonylcarbamoyltransferase complex ATPase subunit type 1 TsaE [Thermoanaerobacteraceae bacterium]
MQCYLADERETILFGRCLGALLAPQMVVALRGELGAGKTTLTKGIAEALSIAEPVTSPTFTLLNIYRGRLELVHIDAYRLSDAEEGYYAGLEEYLPGSGVTIIEWPENIAALLPRQFLEIKISYKDLGRELEVIPHGEIYAKLEKELEENCL